MVEMKIEQTRGAEEVKPLEQAYKNKMIIQNNIIELVQIQRSTVPPTVKAAGGLYVDTRTGETITPKEKTNRSENIKSVRHTLAKMRRIINANFSADERPCHIVLTYSENMTDTKRLYHDCDVFMKRLKRYCKIKVSYFIAVEPQKRGAWHAHIILKAREKGKFLTITKKDVAQMWEHGTRVSCDTVDRVDNIGAYLSCYLSNMNGTKKKGERLYLYPKGINMYRHSRDVKAPKEIELTAAEVKKITGSAKPCYQTQTNILNDNGESVQQIVHLQYNLSRDESQISAENGQKNQKNEQKRGKNMLQIINKQPILQKIGTMYTLEDGTIISSNEADDKFFLTTKDGYQRAYIPIATESGIIGFEEDC